VVETSIVGVDESGKGDFFGPLVIAAFAASGSDRAQLQDLGVRDSKQIADKKLVAVAARLREALPHAVVVIPPQEYNRRWEKLRNLNKLLAEGHAEAIDLVLERVAADIAISDKFGKAELIEGALRRRHRTVALKQLVRGERVIQVAAASMIARAVFIEELSGLSRKCGVLLPKGAAAQVDTAGRIVVQHHGVAYLRNVAKVHFKNYQRVVNQALFA